MSSLLVLAPMRMEARAVSGARVAGVRVARVGVGRRAAHGGASAVRRGAEADGRGAGAGAAVGRGAGAGGAVAVMGVAGGLVEDLAPGALVVADRLLDETGQPVGDAPFTSAPLVAAALRRAGLTVRVGPIVCPDRPVLRRASRDALAAHGALAVDMESAAALSGVAGSAAALSGVAGSAAALSSVGFDRPVAVVRAVSDTPSHGLLSPAIVPGGLAALRALRAAVPAVASWAAAAGPRTVLLAGPRSFCAGVERAIQTVERALDRWGAPVYVRRQIVHNRHVVADLEARGAIFVQELDEVPDGATVVFSAHGVAPEVRAAAAVRDLQVVDATCPLVARVHTEVRRFRDRGLQVVLVGHAGHDETEGTLGEAPDIQLVSTPADVAHVRASDPSRVAYVTQTTLAPDDVAGVVDALQDRFPALVGPHAADICYATQNRQDAVKAMVGDCDLLLVVGSGNSSNTARLAEVARRAGCRAELIDDETDIEPDWLLGANTIGLTAGASAPSVLVDRVVSALSGLGPVSVSERLLKTEAVSFPLPVEVR